MLHKIFQACVVRLLSFLSCQPMALAGGDRFVFQWEGVHKELDRAIKLASAVVDFGMKCGVSINPNTEVDAIYPLLETGLVDLVDVLAVEPGFGGQKFQPHSLDKVRALQHWRDENGLEFDILVDGGINQETASAVIDAGADILVAGTFLFQHPRGIGYGVSELLSTHAT
jgi:ribulose-phosphate 3-epimerase